jgi:2-polyprenyl-6-methoxyphenol hydroxylase-like FAD-dependent oxidoreductase
MTDHTDVVIAGGSVAGCALATLLGRQGVHATVLEKSTKPDHYKVVCSHFIQAGGTPVLERLGLVEAMEAAGAVRNGLELWTGEGWVVDATAPYGYNLRREKLDPMLRELAAGTPNVEMRHGVAVTELLRDADGRPAGVRGRTPGGDAVEVRAKVVVGADGRGSAVARLAGVPGRVLPHNRFGYMAYYRDLEIESGDQRSLFWFRDRDVLYAFPNDDGVTVLAMFLHKDHLPAFKADKETAFAQAFDGLPRRPAIERATRISPLIGKLDVPNVRRPAARPGVAFVGDAAQASDPLWGVGVGFALQAAAWLSDEIAGPLLAGGDVDAALARYHRRHRRYLAGHHLMMSDYASGRRMNPMERVLYRAALRDPQTARLISEVGARARPLQDVMRPRAVARALVKGIAA